MRFCGYRFTAEYYPFFISGFIGTGSVYTG